MIMPSPIDMTALAEVCVGAALRAGTATMREFRSPDCRVERKSDGSPVTSADLAAERIILEALALRFPGIPVVSEEAGADSGSIAGAARSTFFLIDPLDGTREFSNGCPEFTVNIALIHGGRPVAGVIYAPAFGEVYVTMPDGGSRWAAISPPEPDAPVPRLAELPLKPMAGPRPPEQSAHLRLLLSPRESDQVSDWVARSGLSIDTRAEIGSSYKFCLIARGDADIYPRFGTTMIWDTAAAQAILEATGGSVLSGSGEPLTYGRTAGDPRNTSFLALAAGLSGAGLMPLRT